MHPPTPPHLPTQLPAPAFGVRILALLIDFTLILGWMAVLAAATLLRYAITGDIFNWLVLGPAGAQLLGFMVLVLPVGCYLFLTEASVHQATIGKRVLGLRVIDAATGARPTRAGILARTVIKLLPWEIAHFAVWNLVAGSSGTGSGGGELALPLWLLLMLIVSDLLPVLYVLMVAFEPRRRGPHDLAAGTRVVTDKPVVRAE